MLKPLDKELAFAAIAEELELPLVLLSNPDPRVRLAQLEKIGAALSSTNLTWRDLAERVTAPRPAPVVPSATAVPPMPVSPLRPRSEIAIDPAAVLSNEELQRLGGYRTAPVPDGHDTVEALGAPTGPAEVDFVDAELQSFGYRDDPRPCFGRYGYGPIPDTFETIAGESDEDAGQRLALWAIAKTGQPFYEDPDTGRGYLPGVTVPGRGKVQPDGTLGPLPADD